MGVHHKKPFFLFFWIWKRNWKILFQSRVMGLWKYYIVFLFYAKKCRRHWNYEDLRTDWYNFSKIRLVQYYCTQFYISGITVSRDMGHGQKRTPRRTLSLKSQDLIGLRGSSDRCHDYESPQIPLNFYLVLNSGMQKMFVSCSTYHGCIMISRPQ